MPNVLWLLAIQVDALQACGSNVKKTLQFFSLSCISCLQPLRVSALNCYTAPLYIYILIQVISSDHRHHAQHNTFILSDNETTPLPLISSLHELDNSSDSWLQDWWAPRSRALASVWRAIPSACNEPRLASSPAHRARHPRLATVRRTSPTVLTLPPPSFIWHPRRD